MTASVLSVRTHVPGAGRSSRGRAVLSRLAIGGVMAATFAGCTAAQKAGQSSSYLIIQALEGASGATPDKMGATLSSDVQTLVKQSVDGKDVLVPTIYADPGRVIFRLGLKDPGTADSPTKPSSANFITVNRYRVNYIRTDGRNTPGVDVPYGFDSAITATVTADVITAGLTLVRIQAKQEAPLMPLVARGGALAISTIAEVTFYGTDQSGREVSATGRIDVTFADWGDPASGGK